ncbi:MAG TPA: hypothetical protein VFC01_33930, partial [Mycobacterium sp.]|nr:hypothetical protein [Mycobacterium sp.]
PSSPMAGAGPQTATPSPSPATRSCTHPLKGHHDISATAATTASTRSPLSSAPPHHSPIEDVTKRLKLADTASMPTPPQRH